MEQLLFSHRFSKAGTSWNIKGRQVHFQQLPVGGTLDHSVDAERKGEAGEHKESMSGSRKALCEPVPILLGLEGKLEPGLSQA